MFRFNNTYFLIAIVILCIEIGIAIFLNDGFIRYTFGDFLATILVYTALKSVLAIKPNYLALITLSISYTLEGLQYCHILEHLKLDEVILLKVVMGSHFSIEDLVAYTLGTILIYLIDKQISK